jgi:hypothetical protein
MEIIGLIALVVATLDSILHMYNIETVKQLHAKHDALIETYSVLSDQQTRDAPINTSIRSKKIRRKKRSIVDKVACFGTNSSARDMTHDVTRVLIRSKPIPIKKPAKKKHPIFSTP